MNLLVKGFLAIYLVLSHSPIFGQTCKGDVSLRSQAEVDEFFSVTGGCPIIDGDLEIWDIEGAITNLTGISHIKSIKGNLEIFHCNKLKHLGELASLDTVYGNLRIEYNDSLFNILELDSLVIFGSAITLNGAFTELPVFPAIDSLDFLELNIPWVTEVKAFPNLKVANKLYLSVNLLPDLTGFSSLESINTLNIRGWSSLSSLNGLENIGKLQDLSIAYTHLLQNLSGLDNLSVITGNLEIEENLVLSSIDALQNIDPDSLDRITFYENPTLAICNLPFLCEALARPDFNYGFNNNAPGCNDFWQVAKNCQIECPVNLVFRQQSEVDSFAGRFPDCTFIEGGIDISSDIYHLDSLHVLTGLGGDLIINDTKLKSLDGLDNFDMIGGNLKIAYNDSLSSLAEITDIIKVNDLIIEYNTQLTDMGLHNLSEVRNIGVFNQSIINGFNNLRKVTGDFSVNGRFRDLLNFTFPPLLDSIHGKLSLIDLDSLVVFPDAGNLNYIGTLELTRTNFQSLDGLSGVETIDSNIYISQNPKLQSLAGIDNINFVGNSIEIAYNNVLTDVAFVGQQEQINGDLLIFNNGAMTSLTDLESIKEIKGNLRLAGMSQVTTLSGIHNLQKLGGDLRLSYLGIPDMTGLDQLSTIGGSLYVQNIASLTSYHGLENLDSIYGEASIAAIPSLGYPGLISLDYIGGELLLSGSSVDGLDSLKSVGSLFIAYSSLLQDLSSLRNIQEIRGDLTISDVRKVDSLPQWTNLREIGGNVLIEENYLLTDLSGLDSLRFIHGSLTLSYLGVDTLKGLDKLQTVDGGLHISYAYMHDLDPLQSLQQVNGRVEIFNNSYMKNIQGLSNIDPETVYSLTNTPDISIYENQLLSDCSVEIVCEALESDNKTIDIHSNSNGCTHPLQVEFKCLDFACVSTDIHLKRQSEIDSFNILFPGCGVIKGDLIIREETPGAIQNIDSLYIINTIGGHLEVFDNEELENVDGLSNLRRVGGKLRIVANDHLTSISGFAHIDPSLFGLLKPGPHDVTIINNPLLDDCAIEMVCKGFTIEGTSFSIFDNNTSCSSVSEVKDHCNFPKECAISGKVTWQYFIDLFPINYPGCEVLNSDLIIESNYLSPVVGLHGFQKLKQINGDLMIIGTNDMFELTGLDSLVEVRGRIVIRDNLELFSLRPLARINKDSLRAGIDEPLIEVTENIYLAICAIEPLCAALTDANDSVLIHNNRPDCNSIDEVLAHCIVSTTHPSNAIDLHIYPNPTTGELNFEFDQNQKIQIHAVNVYDHLGSLVDSKNFSSTLSLDHLNNGLYTLIFTTMEHQYFSARVVLIK